MSELEELPTSLLGTEKYWDDFYSNELVNYADSKDEGEVWFGYNRMKKTVHWLLQNKSLSTNVLDIGAGNGSFLLELAKRGFTNLHGLDYSKTAVDFAVKKAAEQDKNVSFKQADILDCPALGKNFPGLFDVCHDNGTYDAISLREDAKIAREQYLESLNSLLRPGACFVITSCNWTLDELKLIFIKDLEFLQHIPVNSFQFGGKSGSTTSTGIFIKQGV